MPLICKNSTACFTPFDSCWAPQRLKLLFKMRRSFLHRSFKDADFLGELRKPNDQRKVQCKQICQEEAVQVWQRYANLPADQRVPY